MSYQVLARKWRPRRFAEVVGQSHVIQALQNALERDQLHHAYLFTGTRGVGKTTLARIFAKALNCERGVGREPCGECTACREIDDGRFVDLLEVDAASRSKVEQTRELLDNVPYAPTRGRYKVYLIDEVHMFSQGSFNALLKTLEEPPPHVKFLLATTDPQRLPVTVLSRCLQFNLQRLGREPIAGHLGRLLAAEGVAHDVPALDLLAAAADGSVRDALSLLDQAIAFGGGEVREAAVREMLGTVTGDASAVLLRALAAGDGAGILDEIARLAGHTSDMAGVLGEVLGLLHRVAVVQQIAGIEEDETVTALAREIPPEDLQLFYQIGVLGRQELDLAPDPRTGLEMVLLRMLAFRPDGARAAPRQAAPAEAQAPRAPAEAAAVRAEAPTRVAADQATAGGELDWHALVARLGLKGIARELADNCEVRAHAEGRLELRLDPACQNLRVPGAEQRLVRALRQHLGEGTEVRIQVAAPGGETPAQRATRERAERQREAERRFAADPLVNALGEELGAEVVPGSVRPARVGNKP